MKKREHLLGMVVLGFVGLVIFGFAVRSLVLTPVHALDKQIKQLHDKLDSIKKERTAFFTAEKEVAQFAKLTFSDNLDQANAKAGVLLNELILRVGLSEGAFTRIPAGTSKRSGAREVGWSVQGEGPFSKIVDLIFLLEQTPVLHQIQNLALSPGDKPGTVRVRFRYLTLVLDPSHGQSATNVAPVLGLESPDRALYQAIVQRDFFRPYVKRERSPDPAPAPAVASAPSPAQNLRVVSLSEWNGRPEVHVRDQAQQSTKIYHLGDTLLDTNTLIVAVDYRPMPKAGNNAGLQSYSRVILQSGNQFWAVERGQTLADRYQLTTNQLRTLFNSSAP